jgi:hypothetical protein
LRLLSRFEPTHLPFSLSGVLMRDFRTIVGVTGRVVSNVRQHRSQRCSITLQLVGDDPQWFFAFVSQQPLKESLGCPMIPTRLKQNVDDVAILIHGAPKVLLLAVDSHEKFIHMPAIAETPLPLPKTSCIVSPKLLTPTSNRFVGD